MKTSKQVLLPEISLDAIKRKLMHQDSGEGWTRAHADTVEQEYRRFLYLMKSYPDEDTSPSEDVDTFWHYHILDTMKYAADCEQVFGYFLHHYPYLGLDGDTDESDRERAGARMRELYAQAFGDSGEQGLAKSATDCGVAAKVAYCGASGATTAYCGVTAKVAYCGATTAKTAYCGAPRTENSYFGATVAKTTYCGAAPPQRHAAAVMERRFPKLASGRILG